MANARSLVLFGLFSLTTINSCGGKTPTPEPGPGSGSGSATITVIKPPDPPKPVEPPPAADRPPELFEPAIKEVGVGQTISFSTAAIDQDLDETRVEVTKMPASAKFDAIAQTVTWTPTKTDLPKGEFTIQVTQPGKKGQVTETWTIDVDKKKQVLPVAEQQSAVIETLLLIRQPKRLEQVNKDWPLDKMLLVGAEGFKPQFAADKAAALTGKLDKKILFEGMLSGLALTHGNPRLDPKAPEFDKIVFKGVCLV